MGIKTKDNPKIKSYCYKSECEYVTTGFHLEKYTVCTVCKEEISDNIKQQIDSRKKKEEKRSIGVEEEWDSQQFFPYIP